MRVLFLANNGDGYLDGALRAQTAGHKVKCFVRKYDPRTRPIGKGLVELVADWRPHMEWADLVLLEDNGVYMKEMPYWRAKGCRIIGGDERSAAWEIERTVGMSVFKRAGITIPPYREFDTYDEAIAYTKRRDEPFVSKPCGAVDDKSLSYVAKTPADLVYMLGRWKKKHSKPPCPFILQEKIEGVEFAVGAWWGPAGWAGGWEENFEHKKMLPGDLGPNCYSADTEVLTKSGWKFWPDIGWDDQIGTLVNGMMTFERPTELVAAPFEGELIHWRSNRIDLLVTPGHQMHVVDRRAARQGNMDFNFVPAHEVASSVIEKKYAVLLTSGWEGEPTATSPEMARMLGIFLADGFCKERSVVFGNCPAHKQLLIRQAAIDLGLTAQLYGSDVYINSKRLADICRVFPSATEKRAPEYIMRAGPLVIKAFLDGLALDAATRHNNLIYTTASRGMADDIQIMAARIGGCGIIRERDRRNEPDRLLNGHVIHGSLSWDVEVSFQSLAWLQPRFCKTVPYKGMVYCATVSSHVLYVRRNGKPCWNGQTGEMGTVTRYVRSSKLADRVLRPLEPQLERLGYVGNVDVNCIVDSAGVPWPLEFTMRFGWPAWNIETALFNWDPIEFLLNLAEGSPTRGAHVLDQVAVGVVLAIPPYPGHIRDYDDVIGIPLYGSIDTLGDFHPCEIQSGKEVGTAFASAGDYIGVGSGVADTINRAARKAYKCLDDLHMPASPFHRGDIGRAIIPKIKKSVPELQEHGFARGLQY